MKKYDNRQQGKVTHNLKSMLVQRIYGIALGYEDLNDHITIRKDPGFQTAINTDSDLYSAYRGRMTINSGLNIFGDLIFQPNIYGDSDYFENRTSSVLWGMMRNRKRFGIYLSGDDRLKISYLQKSINGSVEIPYIIVDASETTKVDSSTYRASKSIGSRQIVAMNNLRISLSNYSEINYLIELRKFDNLTEVKSLDNKNIYSDFILCQNYPNPFNPTTTISYSIPEQSQVELKVFDVLGREVAELVNKEQPSGSYQVNFDASNLGSGVYFYQIRAGSFMESKKMILLK